MPLRKLGFLTIGVFDRDDPAGGHESTLEVIELGERLGYDSAWLRHRHLQYGISSPIAVMAAASQRTSRIELGTAVTPLGWENPLRLAEDLATVDVLTGGRVNPGLSVGPPMQFDRLKHALYPDTAELEDFGYGRLERLLAHLRGEPVAEAGTQGIEVFSERVEPHSPGLADRVWYGAASLGSARWAGEHGLNLLTSSVVKAEESEDFAEVQRSQIVAFRAAHPLGGRARVSQGLVVIPTDSATPEQRQKYEAYAAARLPRTATPQGPGRLMFAPDLVGPAESIAERLEAHAGYREVDEVAFALPFSFAPPDYVQILTDVATGSGLRWAGRPPETYVAPVTWTVRSVRADDHDRWRALYRGYADFYRVTQTDDAAATVWAWLGDPAHEVSGLVVAGEDGRVVGLAHYRPFARPLAASTGCYLDDLFVDPAHRGTGAGAALLTALADLARERGWSVVRWITAADNAVAQATYDRVATRTGWVTYDLAPA